MTLTGTGVVIGTPQYMSPEQAMGKRGDELDGRSDLYSLGIVMYQMLTGELPFKADTTMEMLIAHLQQPPINVCTVRPELHIPVAVAGLVMRLLEKQPEGRPASAQALIDEIEQAEAGVSPPSETHVISPLDLYEQQINPPPVPPPPPSRQMARPSRTTSAPIAPAAEPARRAATPPPVPARPPAAPRPAVAPPPAVRIQPPPAARAKKPSQVGIWAGLFILGFGLAGGVWYFTEHQSGGEPQPVNPLAQPTGGQGTTPSGTAGTVPSKEPASQPPISTPTEPQNPLASAADDSPAGESAPVRKPAVQPAAPKRTTPSFVQPLTRPVATDVAPKPQVESPPVRPAADAKKVSAAIKMGEFYFDRGEYEKAVEEYEQGLALDPSNQDLRTRVGKARRAKVAEDQLNQ
jgi:serine/threonine protein kinase